MELEEVPREHENDSKKQRKKRQRLLIIELFSDFAENTSLHGLRYITEVGLTIVEKVFWFLTFMVSVVLCFMLIERVYHKWLYSPVIVSFNERMVPVGEVPFPSITICPQWKCKSSIYDYTEKLIKYGRVFENIPDEESIYYENKLLLQDMQLIKKYSRSCVTRFYRVHTLYRTYDEQVMLEDAFLVCSGLNKYFVENRTMANKSLVDHIMGMAPKVDDSIVMCTWRGARVACQDYFKEVLTSEGVCYNFNSLSYTDIFRMESIQTEYKYLQSDTSINKWKIVSGYETDFNEKQLKNEKNRTKKDMPVFPRRAQENGPLPDLTILLLENLTDVDEACNSLANGWKIYLHHPADMPQASLYYYAAIPSQITSLALKFSVLNTSESLINYTPEQRQCYFPGDRDLEYFSTYTPDNCRLECLSKYTYKKCNCVWFHMPHSNSSEICTAQKRLCVKLAQAELASNRLNQSVCNCLPACNTIRYDAEILKAALDLKKYANAMKKVLNYTLPKQDGYSRLELYFKDPQSVSMNRSELFGLTDFLANCGGLLGLFLGFSFLSLVEMFYFCTLRLWCALKKDIKSEEKQNKKETNKIV